MTEAHPLRCETCDNKGFAPDYVTQLNGSEFQCYGGKVVRDLTKERLTLISIVGCASHSSAKSDVVLDDIAHLRGIVDALQNDVEKIQKELQHKER